MGGPSIEDQAVIEIWVHLNSFNLVGVVAEKSRQRKSSNLLQLLQCETAWPPSILVEKSAEKKLSPGSGSNPSRPVSKSYVVELAANYATEGGTYLKI